MPLISVKADRVNIHKLLLTIRNKYRIEVDGLDKLGHKWGQP